MNYNVSQKIHTLLVLLLAPLAASAQKENMDTIADPYHLSAYFVAAMLIAVFVMIFSNRVYFYREREVRARARQLNTQLGLVLGSNNTQVWTYDIQKKLFSLLSESGEKKDDYLPLDFSQFFQHDDFRELRSKILLPVADGNRESGSMLVRSARKSLAEKTFDISISVLHRHSNGSPKVLLGIQRDVTEENTRHENARRLAMRYHTVFNMSLVDMVYYDENGILTDINDKACETFNISDRETLLNRKIHITDVPAYRNLDLSGLDNTEMSSITDITKTKQADERIPKVKADGQMYYEVSLSTIRDNNGGLHGIITAGRDISEMVFSHHQQKYNRQLLEKATHNIQDYINNINYTLRISGVRMISYNPDTHILEIASDINKVEYQLSQIRCASLLAQHERRRARGLLLRMDRKRPGAFVATFETIFHDEKGRSIYQTLNMVPVTGKDGNITSYFGMARNDTEMYYTEARLREETLKAQETEELKNTFLMNMSYEIRTPLNAVLGFAELFNGPHDEADEPIFAEEIKRNTGNLLALINDILFISRLDAKMVKYNYHEVDFAMLFDGWCYMGWSNVSPDITTIVENPYSQLMVTIDDQNLGEVVSKICSMAARNTKEGSMRAKCEYFHGELNINVEFTDPGLSKEDLEHAYDRFAARDYGNHSGTGLDLPIIRELVEQMGGSIELQSEEGKGTAVYIILPCEMSRMEKKTEKANQTII